MNDDINKGCALEEILEQTDEKVVGLTVDGAITLILSLVFILIILPL